jgi:site-specific DNA-methyltransferase (adenine-specific)
MGMTPGITFVFALVSIFSQFSSDWPRKMRQEVNAEIFLGDCLSILKNIESGAATLVYLDPPFLTQKKHTLATRDRRREFKFSDVWSSHEEYCEFLYSRLVEMRRILSDYGSLFFHCDRRATHLARLLLDEVFGRDSFRSEIIWQYRRWSNARKGLLPAHQTIYYYTKTDTFTFNTLFEDYSPSTNVDQILQRRRRDSSGKCIYERDESGAVITSGPKVGVPLSDVWDIPYLNPKANERTGYPTQKPLNLLERIVSLVTQPGDLVVDPFCGSGTTLVAAIRLGRRAIGIDVSPDAIELTNTRLTDPIKSESNLMAEGRDAYRNADESVLACLQGIDYVPVQRNKGIDAFLKEDLDGSPIPIRVQRRGETILEAGASLYRAAQGKKAKIMFLVATDSGGVLNLGLDLPPCVVVVEAPALGIRNYLDAYRDSALGMKSSA